MKDHNQNTTNCQCIVVLYKTFDIIMYMGIRYCVIHFLFHPVTDVYLDKKKLLGTLSHIPLSLETNFSR